MPLAPEGHAAKRLVVEAARAHARMEKLVAEERQSMANSESMYTTANFENVYAMALLRKRSVQPLRTEVTTLHAQIEDLQRNMADVNATIFGSTTDVAKDLVEAVRSSIYDA